MSEKIGHRKLVKHYDEPGHFHELTFSCYQRLPLLTNDLWRAMLSKAIDNAIERHGFQLAAFAYMPEHVHLLVWPVSAEAKVSGLLKAIKQPFSNRIRRLLEKELSPLLDRLTVRERPGKTAFRFWQEGPGYDRNLTECGTITAAIEYIHLNPARRGLVAEAHDWRWSSCRFYLDPTTNGDEALPKIHGLPWEVLNDPGQ